MAQTVAKGQDSPEDIAGAIAENHAAAVEFPAMMFPDDAPVGAIAQRMVDGRYDKAFLISEIERFTGQSRHSPEAREDRLGHPQHGYWASELTLTDQVFRAAGYEVDYVTPRGERPFPYGVSMDPTFRDQAWNAAQVSPGEAALGKRYNDRTTTEGQRLNEPRNLDSWLPPTPRPQHGEASREPFRRPCSRPARGDPVRRLVHRWRRRCLHGPRRQYVGPPADRAARRPRTGRWWRSATAWRSSSRRRIRRRRCRSSGAAW